MGWHFEQFRNGLETKGEHTQTVGANKGQCRVTAKVSGEGAWRITVNDALDDECYATVNVTAGERLPAEVGTSLAAGIAEEVAGFLELTATAARIRVDE